MGIWKRLRRESCYIHMCTWWSDVHLLFRCTWTNGFISLLRHGWRRRLVRSVLQMIIVGFHLLRQKGMSFHKDSRSVRATILFRRSPEERKNDLPFLLSRSAKFFSRTKNKFGAQLGPLIRKSTHASGHSRFLLPSPTNYCPTVHSVCLPGTPSHQQNQTKQSQKKYKGKEKNENDREKRKR